MKHAFVEHTVLYVMNNKLPYGKMEDSLLENGTTGCGGGRGRISCCLPSFLRELVEAVYMLIASHEGQSAVQRKNDGRCDIIKPKILMHEGQIELKHFINYAAGARLYLPLV